ncbi:MAG TPA: DUF6602 domain-containing protein [Terracidiphilus sp.]|nr:DUF6602 domain-containing protein [Terracidiphilus sp.]
MSTGTKGRAPVEWSAGEIMRGLAEKVERDLRMARYSIGHVTALGEATQQVWIRMLETYLPERYRARSATVMDSEGTFSDQIDVVVFDRQYSPTLFEFEGATVVPAEAVYAVFEAKQDIRGEFLTYAQGKVASVRKLKRTSVTIPTINGNFKKNPQWILGGFLALEPRCEKMEVAAMEERLKANQGEGKLDLGCVASVGTFGCGGADATSFRLEERAAGRFLLELMARLQGCGTAPAIDYRAYAKWMDGEEGAERV